MKKFFIALFKFIAVAVWGGVGYMIGVPLAIGYKNSLYASGGVVTARDLLGVPLIPWAVAVGAALIAFRLLFTEE